MMMLFRRPGLLATALLLSMTPTVVVVAANENTDIDHLLDCVTYGSESQTACEALDDCTFCRVSVPSGETKNINLCLSLEASTAAGSSRFQCADKGEDLLRSIHSAADDDDTDDDGTTNDDDKTPPAQDDDYFPPDGDDATFDDDATVDDDKTVPTTDDDDTATTDDDTATTDDDSTPDDDYAKDLMECLAVANQTACAKHTKHPACVWCTTSFEPGLCLSEEAGHDVDGAIYSCQFNASTPAEVLTASLFKDKDTKYAKDIRHTTSLQQNHHHNAADAAASAAYDHSCRNQLDERLCVLFDGWDEQHCVWYSGSEKCVSRAQMNLFMEKSSTNIDNMRRSTRATNENTGIAVTIDA